MKSRETKAIDLAALTESLQNSKSAMVVSFTGLTVQKDQEFRNSLRAAGAEYQVVKNTLARIAVKGTPYEGVTESLKGVTALAWTQNDPVVLSKAISKFMKDNGDIYSFKSGVVEGQVVDLAGLTTIANLPSKEELISQLLFVLQSGAQRIVTVINAVPRDLAVVIKQIGEKEDRVAAAPAAEAVPAAEAEPAAAEEAAPAAEDASTPDAEAPAEAEASSEAATETAAAAPDDASETVATEVEGSQSDDDKADDILEMPTDNA